jgi:hypothetical protein
MKAMLLRCTLFAALAFPVAAADCTFDQDAQRSMLAQVTKLVVGATMDLKAGEVNWRAPDGGKVVLRFGGCSDLGSSVERTNPAAKARTREEISRVAIELAERFWMNDILPTEAAARVLIDALRSGGIREEQGEGTKFFHVNDPHSLQLFVAHEFADGIDRVSIHWQGIY